MIRDRKRIVHIVLEPCRSGAKNHARIYEKNRKPYWQFLSADTMGQLGDDSHGYFEADKIGEVYYPGKRERGGWRW